jgi:hypothetical protein
LVTFFSRAPRAEISAEDFWPSRLTIDDLHMYPVGVNDVQTVLIPFIAGDSTARPQLGDD